MTKISPALKELEGKLGGVIMLEMFSDGTGTIYKTLIEDVEGKKIEKTKAIGFFDCEDSLKELIRFLMEEL
jgi:hypothetical protein